MSVIIPTHDRADLLRRSIGSVLDQTYRDYELIVVDDASTEDIAAVVASFDDPRVRLLRNERNLGGAGSRDRAIDASRGPVVAFLDSDDEWLPTFLEEVMGCFDADPSLGVVETGYISREGEVVLTSDDNIYERLLGNERNICLSSIAVRKRLLGDQLRFDNPTRLAQERHVFMQVAKRSGYMSIRKPLCRLHSVDGARLNTAENQFAKRMRFFEMYEEELALRPKALSRHRAGLGSLLLEMGDTSAARVEFWKAFRANPTDLRWFAWWGVALLGRNSMRARRRLKKMWRPVRDLVT